MKNKGLLIGLGILVVFIIVIIIVVVSKNRRADSSEAEATLTALQQQANNPNLPPDQKQSILAQMENIAKIIAIIKSPGSVATPPISGNTSTGANWVPIASSSGVCKNPALLNKDLILKLNSKGGEVCALQSYLNSTKNAGLVNDGIFGTKTQAALMQATGKNQVALKDLIA